MFAAGKEKDILEVSPQCQKRINLQKMEERIIWIFSFQKELK